MAILQKPSEKRLAVIQIFIVLWMIAIGGKLVWLQVKQHDWLSARAGRQQQAEIELSPTRGVIYDRNGNELARSVEAKSLYASPAEIKDPDRMADRLSELLDVEREALYKRLTSAQVLVAVKRKLADDEVAEVEKLGWPGLRFVNEM
jgi:cell division protein FtsI/penicillin-binding protein 2